VFEPAARQRIADFTVGIELIALWLEIDDLRIRVRNLEALQGTPIVDVKPLLEPLGER